MKWCGLAAHSSATVRLSACAAAKSSAWQASKGTDRRISCAPSTQQEARSRAGVTRTLPASYVSGDRQKEGVFQLWNVLANIAIGRVAARPSLGLVSDKAERAAAAPAAERLRLDTSRFDSRIVELSGGNQQKALVSRAVAAMTPIVLLDDPTRGVDIATKQDFYRLCGDLAREGRTLIWHTTEDAELHRLRPGARIRQRPDRPRTERTRAVGRSHRSGLFLASRRIRARPGRGALETAGLVRAQGGRRRAIPRPCDRSGRHDRRQSVCRVSFRRRPSAHACTVACPGHGSADVRGRRR